MKDDGYRLSFSIKDDSFVITDTLNGTTIINTHGKFVSLTLDVNVAMQHIQNLQEAIMSYSEKWLTPFNTSKNIITTKKGIVVRENSHFSWSIGVPGNSALLENEVTYKTMGFDKLTVLNGINYVYSQLLIKQVVLNPKRDIVRRIIDVGLLVWVHEKNSLAVYEKNVSGNLMTNCLINGVYFNIVIVSSSRELGKTTLFNSKLEEIVSFPLDDSILAFYPIDEDAFD